MKGLFDEDNDVEHLTAFLEEKGFKGKGTRKIRRFRRF